MRLYIVKAGDTLSSIAEKYGLELAQLLALNPQITDPDNITPGMKIKIAVGPVSIAPGQPEGGHPINPVGQVSETLFMQFPVPAAEAGAGTATGGQAAQPVSGSASSGSSGGQTGTGWIGMNGYQTGGWGDMGSMPGTGGMTGTGGFSGTPGMSGTGGMTGTGDITGTTGMGSMTGTGGAAGMGDITGSSGYDSDDTSPYLSTIPQNFTGNPLYSGVGAFGDVSHVQGTTNDSSLHAQAPLSYSYPGGHVQGPLYSESVNVPSPVSPLSTASNQTWPATGAGADHASANMHTPYVQSMSGQLHPTIQPYDGMSTPWPEAYTWSAPFDYMTTGQANATLANMPNYPPNLPVAGLSAQLPVKKPCGCGGRASVGYYSLAEKRRAEEAALAGGASNGSEETLTAADEARIAALEQSVEELKNQVGADQTEGTDPSASADDTASLASVRRESAAGRSRSRNRKRTGGQKKSTPKVHLHGAGRTTRQGSGPSRSKPWLRV